MHALIVREPWIGHILDGIKSWEMRTSPAPRRGQIALIRKGTGLIVGTAEITDSLPPLDAAALAATRDRHCIPAALDAQVLAAGWVHPWVLRNVRRLHRPLPAGQKPGQVIWVPIDHDVATAVEAQTGNAMSPMTSEREVTRPIRATTIVAAMPLKTALRASHIDARPANGPDNVTVELTDGAIRNGNLSVRRALHLLPKGVLGGSSRDEVAVHRLTVIFHPGESVETDVAGDKMLLRCRGSVADFYARSGAKGGDLMGLRRDPAGLLHVQLMG